MKGSPHPGLGKNIPGRVSLYYFDQLSESLYGAEVVIIAVLSEGFTEIFKSVLDNISGNKPPVFMTVTKGFTAEGDRISRISETASGILSNRYDYSVPWISVGGAVKAAELAGYIPTCSVYALSDPGLEFLADKFSTGYYRVETSGDITGLELCSALKNVYSTALGMCDGLYSSGSADHYDNIKACLFGCALEEMSEIVSESGGLRETVNSHGGAGDLYVTSQSGRNRKFGFFVGSGEDPEKAYRRMKTEGETAEGYMTLKSASEYVKQSLPRLNGKLPLLDALHDIIFRGRDCRKTLTSDFFQETRPS